MTGDEALRIVELIRAYHQPEQPPDGARWVSGGRAPHCAGCATGDPFLDPEWPCPTVRIIDGWDPTAPPVEPEPERIEVIIPRRR